RFKYGVGTFASRAAVMSGNAVADAARKVRAKALRIAATALAADESELVIADGEISVRSFATLASVAGDGGAGSLDGPRIPLATVAVLANPLRYAFDEEAQRATQFATPAGDGPPVP